MVSAVSKPCPHRDAGTRWRWRALAGALGLLLALLLGGTSIASAQSNTGSGFAAAHASSGARAPLLRYRPVPPCGPPSLNPCPSPPDPTDPLTGGLCGVQTTVGTLVACNNLRLEIQQWTRWAAWLLGGFAVLWILIAFFRSSEPFVGHSAEGPWRRIWLRVVEGAAVLLIAWRIGDVATVIEGILWSNRSENIQLDHSTNTFGDPGLVGPPHQAIAQLLGLATATLVQVFLIYLAPRVIVQVMTGIGMVVSGRLGTGFPAQTMYNTMYLSIINSVLQLLALGVAIVYAPTVLIWIFTSLTG